MTRLGGDEFILLLPDVELEGAALVAQKLLATLAEPYRIEQHDLTLTASIGIALYPVDGEDLETLAKNADTAMYRAKQDCRMIGVEALLRWQNHDLGTVSPAEFIPIAEDSGLILSIGEWVLKTAIEQAKTWQDNGYILLIMAVNLSAVQFRQANLPDLVERLLSEIGLPPEFLELELTESVAMQNAQTAITMMQNLHGRGIRLSIDDFGTGYSSLSYLKQFPIYKLKIDQSFVRDISTDVEDRAIVKAIINMAKSLGLKTIAEGVETAGQQEFLHNQGCDEMQGYLFRKPLSAEQLQSLLSPI